MLSWTKLGSHQRLRGRHHRLATIPSLCCRVQRRAMRLCPKKWSRRQPLRRLRHCSRCAAARVKNRHSSPHRRPHRRRPSRRWWLGSQHLRNQRPRRAHRLRRRTLRFRLQLPAVAMTSARPRCSSCRLRTSQCTQIHSTPSRSRRSRCPRWERRRPFRLLQSRPACSCPPMPFPPRSRRPLLRRRYRAPPKQQALASPPRVVRPCRPSLCRRQPSPDTLCRSTQ